MKVHPEQEKCQDNGRNQYKKTQRDKQLAEINPATGSLKSNFPNPLCGNAQVGGIQPLPDHPGNILFIGLFPGKPYRCILSEPVFPYFFCCIQGNKCLWCSPVPVPVVLVFITNFTKVNGDPGFPVAAMPGIGKSRKIRYQVFICKWIFICRNIISCF